MRRQQGRLRKDRLSLADERARSIISLALARGFARAGFVRPDALGEHGGGLAARQSEPPRGAARGMEWSWVLSPGSWSARSSILVCCLPCTRPEPDDLSTPGDPHALVAPFARRHYYRDAARMMADVARNLERETAIPRRSVRVFCNSRIPEKPLLAATGLAAIGTNGLAIAPGLGSLFVIAGAVIPLPLLLPPCLPGQEQAPADPCGSCRRCRDACPVGAISAPGVVDAGLCLQGLAGTLKLLPPRVMEAWGTRLYGCQDCQSVCPHNRGLSAQEPRAPAGSATGSMERGAVGPSVSIRRLLSMDAAEVAACFRGTAMGMSWVSKDALVRNALIAAGNSGEPSLAPLVQRFAECGGPVLRETARWAREKLRAAGRGAADGAPSMFRD